ncbi:MAG: zinc-dependent peptidase [Planctomycetes bacterium]|nr:zinc-dependent peptidase [Planctomycetota bacterium]
MRNRRRRKLAESPFPDEWLGIIHHNCRHYATLTSTERVRLLRDVRWFLDEKSIEVSLGLTLTDEMRVTVATQASLLGLGFAAPPFDRLITVILQPEIYVGTRIQREASGLELHSQEQRLGEAQRNGPVLLSWRDVVRQCRDAPDGRNVVLHEFAHLLDMADAAADGIPPLETEEQYRTWMDVTRIEYRRLVGQAEHGRHTLLDWYGATNEAEFFAVATETFFEQSVEMQKLHPRLYDVLCAFYKQDPASRWLRLAA